LEDIGTVPTTIVDEGMAQVATLIEQCFSTLLANGTLAPRMAHVLRLRYWFGYEWDEIAEECEIGIRQVQRWSTEGKEVLRKEFLRRGIAGLDDVELVERRYVREKRFEPSDE
jgi:DNA-directed RNA polymerase specialized sigma24 family protein